MAALRRWRPLDCEGNYALASEQHQTERTLFLPWFFRAGRRTLLCLRSDAPKLLAVAQHEIHVLIEGQKVTDEDTTLRSRHPHAIIHVLGDLPTLLHRHGR